MTRRGGALLFVAGVVIGIGIATGTGRVLLGYWVAGAVALFAGTVATWAAAALGGYVTARKWNRFRVVGSQIPKGVWTMKRFLLVAALVVAAQMHAAAQIRMCIAPAPGNFETYLAAAMAIKRVPVTVVTDCSVAQFRIDATSNSERPSWAATVFAKQVRTNEAASVRIVRLDNDVVAWAYTYNMTNAYNGKQSAAESVAKHLKKAMDAWIKREGGILR